MIKEYRETPPFTLEVIRKILLASFTGNVYLATDGGANQKHLEEFVREWTSPLELKLEEPLRYDVMRYQIKRGEGKIRNRMSGYSISSPSLRRANGLRGHMFADYMLHETNVQTCKLIALGGDYSYTDITR